MGLLLCQTKLYAQSQDAHLIRRVCEQHARGSAAQRWPARTSRHSLAHGLGASPRRRPQETTRRSGGAGAR